MKKIMLTAVFCGFLAFFLGALVTLQANASSAANSASLLIALISVPLVLASVVFSVGAAWVLRSAAGRKAHNVTTPLWTLVWIVNLLLAVCYVAAICTALLQFVIAL